MPDTPEPSPPNTPPSANRIPAAEETRGDE
jgi:hypothetical protein